MAERLNWFAPYPQLFTIVSRRPPTRLPSRLCSRGAVGSTLSHLDNPDRLMDLQLKLENKGINFQSIVPGEYVRMLCPKCGGGQEKLQSFSLFIREDLELAMWQCFSEQCGWRGNVQDSKEGHNDGSATEKLLRCNSGYRELNVWRLGLEPLGEEIVSYFAERQISVNTLERNGVMQHRFKEQIAIAFLYRRNTLPVGCKYRSLKKKFWQEKDSECIFYGLDDVKEASDIIIVEGEIDKLSMEEAGFSNCVSVPNGASQKPSNGLKNTKSTRYQFLYNCEAYIKKASRIILATDSDSPGQFLAEELALCIGLERCWRVRWPRKNDAELYKDANEVLVSLGRDALRHLVENAEPWLPSRTETL